MIGSGTYGPREIAVASFSHQLVVATMNLELHPPGSPHVQTNLDELLSSLKDGENAGVPMPLTLVVFDGRLYHGGRPLAAQSLHASRLLRLCNERRITSLAFHSGLDAAEFLRFLVLLNTPQKRDAFDPNNIARALAQLGIQHVVIGLEDAPTAAADETDSEAPASLIRYQTLVECLQESHVRAYHGRDLEVDKAMGLVEETARELQQGPSGLLSLASQDNIDSFTVGHSVRVSLLALQVGRAANVSRTELIAVGTAALLHDIGKSKVPQEILFKPGRLNNEEWQMMAAHPRLGAEILMEQSDLHPSAVGTAFCHHLAPEGLGYPRPEFPFEPSGVSKLVRVCDVFEALTSVRPYKKALSPIEAYTVMFRNEPDFDPLWLRFFVRVLGLYPVGLRLRLDSGDEAVVVGPGPNLHQPRVRIDASELGGPVPEGAPETFAIGEPVDGVVRQIDSVITHDRAVPVGDDEAQILTQHPHGACLGGLGARDDPLAE